MKLADPLHPHIEAVCSGPLTVVGEGPRAHRSGIDKQPLTGLVVVDERGIPGDEVGDTANHGGVDQALYAYADSDASWWEQELGRPLPPGAFGENLRLVGVDPTGARIGERWRLGLEVEVVVTGPRLPCATLAAYWQEPGIVDRFLRAGRLGAYLRVVTPGRLAADDPVDLLDPAAASPLTVGEVATIRTRERHRAHELIGLPDLAVNIREWAVGAATSRA